jgi:hypothetical protein
MSIFFIFSGQVAVVPGSFVMVEAKEEIEPGGRFIEGPVARWHAATLKFLLSSD